MKSVLVFAALLGLSVAVPTWKRPTSKFDKIVGGDPADKGDHPYQIHLRRTVLYWGIFPMESWGCGGTIVSANYVVTAAHCVMDYDNVTPLGPSKLLIRVGQHDSTVLENHARNYAVLSVHVHPQYNAGNMQHDVAVLEVAAISFDAHVSAAQLAAADYNVPAGTELTVTGWGAISSGGMASDVLLAVNVHAVSQANCNVASAYNGAVLAGMLCAAADGKDSCQGDSGGPLTLSNSNGADILVGVVSWGYGCADSRYPGVYASVSYYRNWIDTIMETKRHF